MKAYYGKTRSKNLIPFPYQHGSRTINGVTFTQNNDGSVTVKGTAVSYAQYYLNGSSFNPIEFKNGQTYTLSGGKNGVTINSRKNNSSWGDSMNGNTKTITFNEGDTYNFIGLYVAGGTTVDTTIYPMLNEGTTALPYQPYMIPREVKVGAWKPDTDNLIPFPYLLKGSGGSAGISYNVLSNGKIAFNGTATAEYSVRLAGRFSLPAGTYTFTGCPNGGNTTTYYMQIGYTLNGVYKYHMSRGLAETFTIDSEVTDCVVTFYIRNGVTVNEVIFSPMLNEGSTAKPFQSRCDTKDFTLNIGGKK